MLRFYSDWALRSFSAASLLLLALQRLVQRHMGAGPAPSAAAINATFAVLGLGGYGLLVQVWWNGSFNEAVGSWF